jgi:hypothetical protein
VENPWTFFNTPGKRAKINCNLSQMELNPEMKNTPILRTSLMTITRFHRFLPVNLHVGPA